MCNGRAEPPETITFKRPPRFCLRGGREEEEGGREEGGRKEGRREGGRKRGGRKEGGRKGGREEETGGGGGVNRWYQDMKKGTQ